MSDKLKTPVTIKAVFGDGSLVPDRRTKRKALRRLAPYFPKSKHANGGLFRSVYSDMIESRLSEQSGQHRLTLSSEGWRNPGNGEDSEILCPTTSKRREKHKGNFSTSIPNPFWLEVSIPESPTLKYARKNYGNQRQCLYPVFQDTAHTLEPEACSGKCTERTEPRLVCSNSSVSSEFASCIERK